MLHSTQSVGFTKCNRKASEKKVGELVFNEEVSDVSPKPRVSLPSEKINGSIIRFEIWASPSFNF